MTNDFVRFDKWGGFLQQKQKKVLIIRFSSFGDIIQALAAVDAVKKKFPNYQCDWLVRDDFSFFVRSVQGLSDVVVYQRKTGLLGLIRLAMDLRRKRYDIIYDAHNNLRSHIVSYLLKTGRRDVTFVRRGKDRFKRWLLFKMGINKFDWPFRGAESFVRPLESIGISLDQLGWGKLKNLPTLEKLNLPAEFWVWAPSAAWEMKRWPIEHWKALISKMKMPVVLVGGPGDLFIEEIAKAAIYGSINLAGKISWLETAAVIEKAKGLVSADTGVAHLADYIGVPNVILIGPTAFGFPSRKQSISISKNLSCQPCSKDGRGRCHNDVYQRCLVDIRPDEVLEKIQIISSD